MINVSRSNINNRNRSPYRIGGSSSGSSSGSTTTPGASGLPYTTNEAGETVLQGPIRVEGSILASGEMIAYQASDSDSGGGSGGGAVTLDELIDVVITSPKAGDLLKYNGERWVNVSEVIIDGGNYKIV